MFHKQALLSSQQINEKVNFIQHAKNISIKLKNQLEECTTLFELFNLANQREFDITLACHSREGGNLFIFESIVD